MKQGHGNGTDLGIGVKATVLVEMLILFQVPPTSRAVVAGPEHAETESCGAPFGEAAHETIAMLPKAAVHAATTTPLSLQCLLAGRFFDGESRALVLTWDSLYHNISVCRGLHPL